MQKIYNWIGCQFNVVLYEKRSAASDWIWSNFVWGSEGNELQVTVSHQFTDFKDRIAERFDSKIKAGLPHPFLDALSHFIGFLRAYLGCSSQGKFFKNTSHCVHKQQCVKGFSHPFMDAFFPMHCGFLRAYLGCCSQGKLFNNTSQCVHKQQCVK